jgi:hypothetical protein
VTVEDPGNELASGGHTLIHLERLAHAIPSFVFRPVTMLTQRVGVGIREFLSPPPELWSTA